MTRALLDLKASREVLVCLESLVPLAHKGPMGDGDRLVMKVELESKVQGEILDPRGHRDPMERMVLLVLLVLPDLL